MFIDVTYQIDYWNSGLFLICIIDNNKNLRICSFGFINVENDENNDWILNEFAKTNDLSKTKYLYSDENFKITEFLDKYQIYHIYCLIHK